MEASQSESMEGSYVKTTVECGRGAAWERWVGDRVGERGGRVTRPTGGHVATVPEGRPRSLHPPTPSCLHPTPLAPSQAHIPLHLSTPHNSDICPTTPVHIPILLHTTPVYAPRNHNLFHPATLSIIHPTTVFYILTATLCYSCPIPTTPSYLKPPTHLQHFPSQNPFMSIMPTTLRHTALHPSYTLPYPLFQASVRTCPYPPLQINL